ncbi:MAG: Ig-like domain-containing protein [Lachnospiraceae bacterium]
MRNIRQTQHHIRFFAWAMAAVIGLLPPFAALAAEENISEENTEQEDTAEEDSEEENEADEDADEKESVSGDDLDDEASISYITAFEPLAEEEAYLSCTEKPGLEDMTAILPETLVVWLEGEEESADLEVEWESEEDFDNTALERYVFYPVWDEALYVPADSVKDTIEIPNITVEVPADEGMIPELEEAKNALQSIIENKSVLALVYLCDSYEVKSEPSAEADTVHTVVSGQTVQITDADLDENGSVWYRTLFYQNGQEYTGYIERGYLAASDEEFMQWEETYIALPPAPMMRKSRRAAVSYPDVDQFPASYQNALYELKNKHPNWVFVKMETGIDWNTAIAKEMGDKSLVPSGSSGSWQNGVYGQGWSYASEGILKYYMDPRNFLTDPAVFQFEQLTYNQSYHTAGAVQEIVKSSFMSSAIPGDSRTYAQAFTTIGQSTGVSPFHLASRVLQEQGTKGTSALISGTYPGYEGYYNYFNVNASGKTDAQVVQNGLKKAKEQGWNTRYKSLNGGAYIIGANYILKGQDTLYLEKFNVSNGYYANFTHQYMQNIQAPNSEASSIRKAYSNAGALENSFVFKIPVFRNMPASACTKPNTTDVITFDKTAVSLAVNKTVKLIPYVNGSKVDYISNMTFKSDAPAVATVDDVGRVTAVSPGTAVISCIGGKGGTAVCKVTVVKADPEVATPTLSPCTYREGLKLADISLPAGWAWANESLKIEVGTQSQEAVYTPEDTVNYNTITRKISFTVTKAIPNCTMPEKPRVFTGSRLGDIALPKGFVWESDTDTVFKEPGEYTFYVSYNPDENNYYPVEHIPLIVQVAGETIDPDEEDGSGGSTGTGSGTGSGGNTGTGSTGDSGN